MSKRYLQKLSRTARWRLPPAEAREVIEDYETMLAEDPRTEEVLCQEVGTPKAAVLALEEPKGYHRWLFFFGVLTVCLLLPTVSTLPGTSTLEGMEIIWNLFSRNGVVFWVLLLAAGTAAVLLWPWDREKGPRPKGLLPLLCVELVGLAGIWFIIWLLLAMPDVWIEAMQDMEAADKIGQLTSACLQWGGGVFFGLLGVYGLVQARLKGRCWRAVYVLGFTVVMLSLCALSCQWCMTDRFYDTGYWLSQYIAITALGLVGTGAALR